MSWVTHKKIKSRKKEVQLSLPFNDADQVERDISEYVSSIQLETGYPANTADNFVSRILFQRSGNEGRPVYRFQGGHWSYE